MYDWYPEGWWTQELSGVDDDVDCSNNDLAKFLERALTIQLPDVSNETVDVGSVRWSIRMFCCVRENSIINTQHVSRSC